MGQRVVELPRSRDRKEVSDSASGEVGWIRKRSEVDQVMTTQDVLGMVASWFARAWLPSAQRLPVLPFRKPALFIDLLIFPESQISRLSLFLLLTITFKH